MNNTRLYCLTPQTVLSWVKFTETLLHCIHNNLYPFRHHFQKSFLLHFYDNYCIDFQIFRTDLFLHTSLLRVNFGFIIILAGRFNNSIQRAITYQKHSQKCVCSTLLDWTHVIIILNNNVMYISKNEFWQQSLLCQILVTVNWQDKRLKIQGQGTWTFSIPSRICT